MDSKIIDELHELISKMERMRKDLLQLQTQTNDLIKKIKHEKRIN